MTPDKNKTQSRVTVWLVLLVGFLLGIICMGLTFLFYQTNSGSMSGTERPLPIQSAPVLDVPAAENAPVTTSTHTAAAPFRQRLQQIVARAQSQPGPTGQSVVAAPEPGANSVSSSATATTTVVPAGVVE